MKHPFKQRRVIDDEQFHRLISTKEFAARFNIVPMTVHQWEKSGKVWGTKIGNRWYFDPESVLSR